MYLLCRNIIYESFVIHSLLITRLCRQLILGVLLVKCRGTRLHAYGNTNNMQDCIYRFRVHYIHSQTLTWTWGIVYASSCIPDYVRWSQTSTYNVLLLCHFYDTILNNNIVLLISHMYEYSRSFLSRYLPLTATSLTCIQTLSASWLRGN